jgi:hypothetical protein
LRGKRGDEAIFIGSKTRRSSARIAVPRKIWQQESARVRKQRPESGECVEARARKAVEKDQGWRGGIGLANFEDGARCAFKLEVPLAAVETPRRRLRRISASKRPTNTSSLGAQRFAHNTRDGTGPHKRASGAKKGGCTEDGGSVRHSGMLHRTAMMERDVEACCTFAALLDMRFDMRFDVRFDVRPDLRLHVTPANADRYSASNMRRFVPPSPTGTSSFARHFGQRPT